MKKYLKALGIVTLAAAVIPCQVEKDEETGVKTYRSLLSRLCVGSGKDGEGTNISLDLLDGIIPTALRGEREEEDYADDELELDTVETEPVFEMSFKVERGVTAEEPRAAADEAQAEADEAQAISDEAQAAADESQAAAEKKSLDL